MFSGAPLKEQTDYFLNFKFLTILFSIFFFIQVFEFAFLKPQLGWRWLTRMLHLPVPHECPECGGKNLLREVATYLAANTAPNNITL